MSVLRPAFLLTLWFAVLTGGLFPATLWSVGQVLFPWQANGSFLKDSRGTAIGSHLIGQNFTDRKYFHPRPSAAGTGYDALGSGGTNLGPISSKLVRGIADDPDTSDINERFLGIVELAQRYRSENLLMPTDKIPADAVTRSGSGLDPEISPQNAMLQARRVADERRLAPEQVIALITDRTAGRFLGIFGEPRVNVLQLNLDLDSMESADGTN